MKKNTLYNLDAISKYSIYSKSNVNYDRILGDRSLKGFVKINKRPKIVKKINILEEIQQKYPNEAKDEKDKKDPHEFISQLILKNSETNKNDINNNNKYYKIFKSQPNYNPQKNSFKNYFNSHKNKKNYQEIVSLDPFKYNPNYDAIFKKVPYVKIVEPKETIKSEIKILKQKNFLTSVPSSIDNTYENENSKNNSSIEDNSKDNSSNDIKLPLVKSNRVYNRNDNNHALRFSKYGNQRNFLDDLKIENEDKDNNKNNFYSNSISTEKINRKKIFTVNFDKMMSRKGNDFVNSYSLKTPSVYRYSPNYDYVKKTPAKISFSYHNENNEMNKKKVLLRKILASYHVDTEFQIINSDKIKYNKSSNFIDGQNRK